MRCTVCYHSTCVAHGSPGRFVYRGSDYSFTETKSGLIGLCVRAHRLMNLLNSVEAWNFNRTMSAPQRTASGLKRSAEMSRISESCRTDSNATGKIADKANGLLRIHRPHDVSNLIDRAALRISPFALRGYLSASRRLHCAVIVRGTAVDRAERSRRRRIPSARIPRMGQRRFANGVSDAACTHPRACHGHVPRTFARFAKRYPLLCRDSLRMR